MPIQNATLPAVEGKKNRQKITLKPKHIHFYTLEAFLWLLLNTNNSSVIRGSSSFETNSTFRLTISAVAVVVSPLLPGLHPCNWRGRLLRREDPVLATAAYHHQQQQHQHQDDRDDNADHQDSGHWLDLLHQVLHSCVRKRYLLVSVCGCECAHTEPLMKYSCSVNPQFCTLCNSQHCSKYIERKYSQRLRRKV